METRQINVYEFPELSDRAKEYAKQQHAVACGYSYAGEAEAGTYAVRLDVTEMARLLLFANQMDSKKPWHRRAQSLMAKKGGAA